MSKFLTFTRLDGVGSQVTVRWLNIPGITTVVEYRETARTQWNAIGNGTTLTISDIPLEIRGRNLITGTADSSVSWSVTGKVKVTGTLTSLLDTDGSFNATPLREYQFKDIFKNCAGIVEIGGELLHSLFLSQGCYQEMFANCTGLTTIPEFLLPANYLAESCYEEMFAGCTNLTNIPHLFSKTTYNNCYKKMFYGCSNLHVYAETVSEHYFKVRFWTTTATDWNTDMFGNIASDSTVPASPLVNTMYYSKGGIVPRYLTFKAVDETIASTVKLNYSSAYILQYRNVGTVEWTTIGSGVTVTVPVEGVEFRGLDFCTSNLKSTMTGKIGASGSLCSLSDMVGSDPEVELLPNCYRGLFANCTSLVSITGDFLPALHLVDSCYRYLFTNTGLTAIPPGPLLPAKEMMTACYDGMFRQCYNLKTVPEDLLSAVEKLADHCYWIMFGECTSLVTVPLKLLPIIELEPSCYAEMFYNCTALTNIPDLQGRILAAECYRYMFKGCSSLYGYTTPREGFYRQITFPSTTAYHWNDSTFDGCKGNLPSWPASNVTYYFRGDKYVPKIAAKLMHCIGGNETWT